MKSLYVLFVCQFAGAKQCSLTSKCNSKNACSYFMEYGCKKKPYKSQTEYLFLDVKRKLKLVARVLKQIAKFDLTKEDFGFVND